MLFKEIHLHGIKSGEITMAFRKWKKALVKEGSLIHTSIGLVKIHRIQIVKESEITEKDALHAGYADKKGLLESFTFNNTGKIYRISVSYHSPDPRIKRRELTDLTEKQLNDLKEKLARLDKYSKNGYWTEKVLLTIKNNPHLYAIGIAQLTGFEKEWLKINIRKLKNLGLTISHNVGYEISPLGLYFIEKTQNEQ